MTFPVIIPVILTLFSNRTYDIHGLLCGIILTNKAELQIHFWSHRPHTRSRFCLAVSFRVRSHCVFFLIATAINPIATNGLYRTQWKCSHYASATTSPDPTQPIVSKTKSQSQIAVWMGPYSEALHFFTETVFGIRKPNIQNRFRISYVIFKFYLDL